MSRLTVDAVRHVQPRPRRFTQPALLFPYEYLMFVAVSAMDVVLTWTILEAGGREVNPLAKLVLDCHGMHGVLAYKFAIVTLVVVLCELIGRVSHFKGRAVVWFAVLATGSVVGWSLLLLVKHVL